MKARRNAKTIAANLSKFSEDFMSERNQPPVQERVSVGAIHELPLRRSRDEKDLPEGWEWKRLGEIADINPRIDKSKIPDELPVSFVPMPAEAQAELVGSAGDFQTIF